MIIVSASGSDVSLHSESGGRSKCPSELYILPKQRGESDERRAEGIRSVEWRGRDCLGRKKCQLMASNEQVCSEKEGAREH